MTKTEKKIDKNIREALTLACDEILELVPGFEWLTHQVDFKSVASTLKVSCIFATQIAQTNALYAQYDKQMSQLIQSKLANIGIHLKDIRQICFDNEEQCLAEHGGNWALRLAC
ncbi:Fis family transcriptional regulator [uncultured Shewanella sp.]|uniref:Fis family transcriptional regulator n=1 Tax=uncultured Shewanella sp. TaxID=173975 RepID=UPI00260DD789|nr:Fis family transcriptional regulator [uncultured Shewanella sp.]